MTDLAASAYQGFATAWNNHSDAIDVKALGALIAGAVLAVFVVIFCQSFGGNLFSCVSRTKCVLQCPIVIHIAPNADKLPRLRDPRAPNVRRGGRANTIVATPQQWNNMRAALGPNVPNKALSELLQKHGNDVHSAVEDYFGLQAGSRW